MMQFLVVCRFRGAAPGFRNNAAPSFREFCRAAAVIPRGRRLITPRSAARRSTERSDARTPQPPEDGFARMSKGEFEAILARTAQEGAKRALADVGIEGEEVALDIRDLRSLLDCICMVSRRAGSSRRSFDPSVVDQPRLTSACRQIALLLSADRSACSITLRRTLSNVFSYGHSC